MSFTFYFLLILFLMLCVLLIFIIMIQESKSMGLGASFGGDSKDSVFGTSTADVLKKFTGYLAFIFLTSCVLLSLFSSSLGRKREAKKPSIEEVSR